MVGIRRSSSEVWWVAHHASLFVRVGQQVYEGSTKIGIMGRTGNVTGIHAHCERRVGGSARPGTGTATNPRSYYTSSAGGGATPLPDPIPVPIYGGNSMNMCAYLKNTGGAAVYAYLLVTESTSVIWDGAIPADYAKAEAHVALLGRDPVVSGTQFNLIKDEAARRKLELAVTGGGDSGALAAVLARIQALDVENDAEIAEIQQLLNHGFVLTPKP